MQKVFKPWNLLEFLKQEYKEQHANISERARSLGGSSG